MKDLIDRKELLNSRVYSTRSGKLNYEKMLKNLVNDILTAPNVDTERHAHWIRNEKLSKSHIEKIYNCSNCQYEAWGEEEKTNYCSNCGCKMDKH